MPTTLDKPPGLPVFPPHDDPDGDCLLKRLLRDQPSRGRVAWPDGFGGGIAHRLDNGTSGAVLVADTPEELAEIRRLFAAHAFVKTYLLLAAKDVPWSSHTCDKPIAHDPRRGSRMVVKRGTHTPHRGKWYPAETEFRRVGGRLFEVRIRSGVTHQIRLHAAFVGMPILGDRLYGGGPTPPWAPPGVTFFLHHRRLCGPGGLQTAPIPDPPWTQSSDWIGDAAMT